MIAPAPIVAIASQLAGVPVTVTCLPSSQMDGASGSVLFHGAIPDHAITLDAGVCARLSHPATGWLSPGDYLTIEHEAQHIATASTDECAVEALALVNVFQAVRAFHLPAWRSRWVLAHAAAADAAMPAQYHPDPLTKEC